MRDTIRVATTVALTLSAVALAWQFWGIVLLFIISLAVAAMMREPIDWFVKKKLSTGLATALVLVIGLGAIALLVFAIAPVLINRIPLLVTDFTTTYSDFKQQLMNGSSIQKTLATRLPNPDVLFGSLLGSDENGAVQVVMNVTTSFLDILLQSVSVIFLASYWSMDRTRFERLWLSLLPPNQRIRMRKTWRAIETDVGSYLRSETVQAIFGGLVLFAVFFLIGVKYPVTLACLVASLWLLPVIGPLVAVGPTLMVGFINGPGTAILATLAMLIIYAGMQLYVERKLYHGARYASTISLLLMLMLVDAMGIVGLLVAPILASILQIVIDNTLIMEESPIDTTTIQSLAERIQQLHLAMQNAPSATPPTTANLAVRLEKLVNQIEGLSEP